MSFRGGFQLLGQFLPLSNGLLDMAQFDGQSHRIDRLLCELVQRFRSLGIPAFLPMEIRFLERVGLIRS
jgi:hypothetical protein